MSVSLMSCYEKLMSSRNTSPVILQVLPALNSGGVERGTLEMVAAISDAGACPLVASAGGRLEPGVRYAGGQHFTIPLEKKNPLSILKNAKALEELIRRENVSLVHARSRAPAWAARLACRRAGVPLVTTWHGVHDASFPGKKHWNAVLASGQRVIAISHYIASRIRESYRVGEDRLRTIPRGADVHMFDPDVVRGTRVQELAELWDIPDDAFVMLLPGRLTGWKGQGVLLSALQQISQEADLPQNWVCVFVGEAGRKKDYAKELVEQSRLSGIAERVRFAGHCSDMPAAFALANVVVVPSLRPEPFGRVVVEAQAMRKPVIVAAHGAAMETVRHGETGLLVPPGDVAALAEMLAAVLSADEEQIRAMGEHARASVLDSYTTEAMQNATLRVYDELLGTALGEAGEPIA